jgi:dTDP-4-amino-4,6-dideoxygalactose transaminase
VIPVFDLSRQHREMGTALTDSVSQILLSGRCVLGPEVEALEGSIAAITGAAHAFGVSNGTDALALALMACRIGPGDEVVTTPFTFLATASAIARVGAVPVFADIDPATLNLDPSAAEAACGRSTGALLPVHLFGLPCDLPALQAVARAKGLRLVEDMAQAFGARREGVPVGAWGDAGCVSFYPTKVLGAAGDAGAVVTGDPEIAAHLRRLRVHGTRSDGLHGDLGGNFRLDAIQAAVLRAKLPRLDGWLRDRARHARLYREGLAGTDFVLPPEADGRIWSQFCLRHPRRDAVREHLGSKGIATAVYYPVPLHLQPCFAELGHKPGDFPHAEAASREILALPLFPELRDDERDRVIEALREFDRGSAPRRNAKLNL